MIKDRITVKDVIDLLNAILAVDPQCTQGLIMSRMQCNDAILEHPTIQAVRRGSSKSVSTLGLLNGLFGVYDDGPKVGHGPIVADVEDVLPHKLIRFRVNHNEQEAS